jgi:uncharacterized membrane-anchored protein YhcB (DUF1043 family)
MTKQTPSINDITATAITDDYFQRYRHNTYSRAIAAAAKKKQTRLLSKRVREKERKKNEKEKNIYMNTKQTNKKIYLILHRLYRHDFK